VILTAPTSKIRPTQAVHGCATGSRRLAATWLIWDNSL